MRSLPRPAAATVAALALTAAGCGGASGSSGQLGPAQYRSQAGAICQQASRRVHALALPTAPGQVLRFVRQAAAIYQRDTDRLRALTPPPALRAGAAKAIADQQRAVDGLNRLAARARGGRLPLGAVQQAGPAIQRLGSRANADFRAIGVARCAR